MESSEKSNENGRFARRFFSSIAGLLLQPVRGGSTSSRGERLGSVNATGINEKDSTNEMHSGDQGHGLDVESQQEQPYSGMREDNIDRRRYVRTLPPWIHSLAEGEDANITDPQAHLLPSTPSAACHPHRNHMPIPKPRPDGTNLKLPDKFKNALNHPETPVGDSSRWQAFARASAFPRTGGGQIVSQQWMDENLPDLDRPLTPSPEDHEVKTDLLWFITAPRRQAFGDRWNRTLMRNAFVPLVIRMFVMAFCAAALALGAWIYVRSQYLNKGIGLGSSVQGNSHVDYVCEQQTSTYMAFAVNAFAVLYLFYITWDEYFSKPLGLRRTRAKLRLLFLDLFFIVFSAADLSLAFNTLTDAQWSCFSGNANNSANVQAARTTCVYDRDLCNRQKALVVTLLIAEVAWLMTFSISILRVVERISA